MLWTQQLGSILAPAGFHGDPLVADDLVLIGGDAGGAPSATGFVYAFERAGGEIRWQHRVDGGSGSDILRSGSRVYAASRDYRLLCLDLASGEPAWSFTPEARDVRLQWTPIAVAAGRVFFGGQRGVLYALQADSGSVLWKRDLGSRVTSGFLVVGSDLLLATADSSLHRIDQATGDSRARVACGEILAKQPDSRGDSLFYFFGQQSLTCVDRDLRVRWRQALPAPPTSTRPYCWGDLVLVGDQGETLTAFGAADGSRRWARDFEGAPRGLALTERHVYLGTLKGLLHAYTPPAR